MSKKTILDATKKLRVFKTRDIYELTAISEVLYKEKVRYKITVKTYTPGEPVKYIIITDPMTDERREKIASAIKTSPIVN